MDIQTIATGVEDGTISIDDAKAKEFCNYWPGVQAGLEVLATVVKNPAVQLIIKVVIAVGKAVYNKKCGA